MVELQISRQSARIGLEIIDARYDLKQKKPDLQVSQEPAFMTLDITNADLMIDYRPMLESMGLGGVEFITRSFTNAVKDDFLMNLEKSVQIGYRMAAIENNMPIGEIVFKALEPQNPELTVIPLAPAELTYIPAAIEMQAEPGGVKGKLDYGKVDVENFDFPSVRVYLEQEPYLKIEAIGQAMDIKK